MRAPADLADGILMAGQDYDGPLRRGAEVEGPDQAVHARGRDGVGPVLVPVVREGLGGRRGGGLDPGVFGEGWGRGVDWDGEREVVGG